MTDIFISYSHQDESWLDYVREHLRTAEYHGEFELWDDRRMTGGDKWKAEIAAALAACRVCVLLVSRHSLTSDYINRVEMRSALERAESDGVRIFPIVLSSAHVPADHWLREFNWRPKDGRPLQGLSKDNDERDKAMMSIVGEIVALTKSGLVASGSPAPSVRAKRPALVDTSDLPDTSLVTLRGRENDLAQLDAAWIDRKTHVFSVVAWGGQGKTALVSHWVDRVKEEGGRGAEAILAWSFYSQGTKERATAADTFLDWALEKLKIAAPSANAQQKADRIAEAMQSRRILLVLDGVEPLQHGPGPQEGLLKDPAMRTLLKRAAADGVCGGLILLTTRLAIADIASKRNGAAPVLDLARLSDKAGAALLRDRGVKGTDRELREAAHDFGGHALALTLLSGFLVRRQGGDVRRRDRIGPLVATSGSEMDRIHGHAIRVMKSMDEEWLAQAPVHAAVMRVVGLFDRPVSAELLKALHGKPEIGGLEVWQVADETARADAIHELREAGLLLPQDLATPGALDAHPLAREWFGEQFHSENDAAWKAAHGRIYEHLRDTTDEGEMPSTKALEPLFQAIPHGCKAGLQQEALSSIYINRICRRDADGKLVFHASQQLGAIGPSLAALAWFFDRPYGVVYVGLTQSAQSWVLAEAAYYLGMLGRLEEACAAHRAALELAVAADERINASIRANNLVEAELFLGDLTAASESLTRVVELADRTDDGFAWLSARVWRARGFMLSGQYTSAHSFFVQAEMKRAERSPTQPLLYSLDGAHYCALLLHESKFAEVADRAAYALKIAETAKWIHIIALHNLSLGRAALGLALSIHPSEPVSAHVREAVGRFETGISELSRSNYTIYGSDGYLARARFFRAGGDLAAARRDLDEVEEIAVPGPMRLHLCDMHIERCRLALAERDGFCPLAATPPAPVPQGSADFEHLTKLATDELDEAAKLIDFCGYHMRDAERDELRDVLAGKRKFSELPIHV